MVINADLLEQRKKISERRPKFRRQESWRYKRLAASWRKPKGIDNKMRLQVSGVPSLVKIGYRGPKASRGLHPSGYVDNLIHNVNELLKLNKDKDAARIAHTVGNKKRLEIILEAESMGIKVLNGKKPESKQPKSDEATLKQDQK
ncbi:MAG TPA: 50S ribosomal protein L32e [Candidatus Nitrosocosmicus sp.]|nr:50S ribosomal protein L32e [Candidatus Nitrosocosmicus sp.]